MMPGTLSKPTINMLTGLIGILMLTYTPNIFIINSKIAPKNTV